VRKVRPRRSLRSSGSGVGDTGLEPVTPSLSNRRLAATALLKASSMCLMSNRLRLGERFAKVEQTEANYSNISWYFNHFVVRTTKRTKRTFKLNDYSQRLREQQHSNDTSTYDLAFL